MSVLKPLPVWILLAATGPLAHGAPVGGTQSVSYVTVNDSGVEAWLVDWKTAPHAAHVANLSGTADGTFSYDGTQRLVTLDAPITITLPAIDCNGEPMSQRFETNQIVPSSDTTGPTSRAASVVSCVRPCPSTPIPAASPAPR